MIRSRWFWHWCGAGILLTVAACLSLQGCASWFLSGSSKLQRSMADAEAEIAATDCRYLYGCVWGPGARDLAKGETCAGLLPTAVATPGFKAPATCGDLFFARRYAKNHLGEAAGVVENGSDAPDLRKKLATDVKGMRRADARLQQQH